jgi:hypothetical protein
VRQAESRRRALDTCVTLLPSSSRFKGLPMICATSMPEMAEQSVRDRDSSATAIDR